MDDEDRFALGCWSLILGCFVVLAVGIFWLGRLTH
jgi:hypothetical protein